MAMVAVGTMIPPRPKQATVPRAMAVISLSGVTIEKGATKASHDGRSDKHDPVAATREGTEQGVGKDSANCCADSRSQTTETNVDGVRIVYSGNKEWPEVEEGEEVHTGDECNGISERYYALTLEEFTGYLTMLVLSS